MRPFYTRWSIGNKWRHFVTVPRVEWSFQTVWSRKRWSELRWPRGWRCCPAWPCARSSGSRRVGPSPQCSTLPNYWPLPNTKRPHFSKTKQTPQGDDISLFAQLRSSDQKNIFWIFFHGPPDSFTRKLSIAMEKYSFTVDRFRMSCLNMDKPFHDVFKIFWNKFLQYFIFN